MTSPYTIFSVELMKQVLVKKPQKIRREWPYISQAHKDDTTMITCITLFNGVTRMGGAGKMSCKVLELHLTDTCQ